MAKLRIKLTEPIVIDGVKHATLELREQPTVADLIAAEKSGLADIEKDLFLYARLAGLTSQDLEQLCLDDYEAVAAAVTAAKKARAAARNPPQTQK